MNTELTRIPPVAPAGMFRGLRNLSPFNLWLLSQLISITASEIIVVGMEMILRGEVTYDYLLTGFVTSLFVSAFVVAGLLHFLDKQELATEALEASEEKFRAFFEGGGDAFFLLDVDGYFKEVNPAACERLGYAREELLGMQVKDICTTESFALRAKRAEALQRNGHLVFESGYITKSGDAVPVEVNSKVMTFNRRPHIFAHVRDISERRKTEEKIEFLAHHDILTGLPNLLMLKDRFELALAYAERAGVKVGLMFLDLDNFKTINDSLGHQYGDALLQEVATRLSGCVRDTDTISRHGGDEFLIVLADLRDPDAINSVAAKIHSLLTPPFNINSHELSTSPSIGVAVYPDDGRDFDTLLKMADTAMYQAKEAGRNTYRFFTERMNADALEQLNLGNALRHGLERKEFQLYYQPQVDLETGNIVGAEALLRWWSSEYGLIMPDRFISIAENSGLIVPIGEWVLNEACRQAVVWRDAGLPNLVVGVNLSAVQLKRGDLEKMVAKALSTSGLDPGRLELELTESMLIHDTEKVLATVTRLKALGIKLAIDDFGTGYSSLSYLRRFQVDKLKIDQSFIRDIANDPEDAAIVRAIVQMARSLKLRTIAEGVESEAMLEHLRDYQCDEAQGYLYSKPMPAEEFAEYLGSRATAD
ncbi:MAG: EAL domain-containing protein [Sterolibacterium sp.]|nr:EAL domain-containing protein [Sterolibacterium sp.]